MSDNTLHDLIELSDSESDSDDATLPFPLSSRETTIDNTPEPINLEDDVGGDGDDYLDVVEGNDWGELHNQKTEAQRLEVRPGHQHVRSFELFGSLKIKPGMNVPLVGGHFLRIKYLTKDKATAEVSMHGWLLKRHVHMNRQMRKATGELALTIWADADDERPEVLNRAVEEHSVNAIDTDAELLTRDIIFTNQTFPNVREWTKRDYGGSTEEHWARGKLICRVKNVKYYSTKGGKDTKIVKEAWLCLTQEEADEGYGVPDISNTIAWRQDRDRAAGQHGRAGSRSESVFSSETRRRTKRSRMRGHEELVEIEESEYLEVRLKQTTTRFGSMAIHDGPPTLKAGDICCGAGGVSGGMEEAGFQVAVGVDSWHPAAETFRLNFPAPTTTYETDVSDFFAAGGEAERCPYCHVVHFSLPCQFFSPAHTQTAVNERDEKNIDTNMIVENALKALRPMYATFENTSGLKEIPKHRMYFDALIKALTDLGWNAVFKIAKLSDYGNPQKRRRLIIIASCPGMPLIEFPAPTHGTEHGLRPLVTVAKAIHRIDRTDPLHNSDELRRRLRLKPSILPLADANAPLRELISTGGPRALHPKGLRRFTFREGMRLMRFRDSHQLAPAARTAGDKWKLIGNAVPRDLIVLIYQDIRKVLQEWFAKYLAPVVLDEDEKLDRDRLRATPQSGALARPELKRKRPANATEIGDSDDEVLPRNPLMPLPATQRTAKKQRRVDEVFGLKKETAPKPSSEEKKRAWTVVDLTDD